MIWNKKWEQNNDFNCPSMQVLFVREAVEREDQKHRPTGLPLAKLYRDGFIDMANGGDGIASWRVDDTKWGLEGGPRTAWAHPLLTQREHAKGKDAPDEWFQEICDLMAWEWRKTS